MLTLGAEGALGFVVSHELVHGHHKMDQWLANVMLCTTGYMHWSVSHIAHHTQVSYHMSHYRTKKCRPLLFSQIPNAQLSACQMAHGHFQLAMLQLAQQ